MVPLGSNNGLSSIKCMLDIIIIAMINPSNFGFSMNLIRLCWNFVHLVSFGRVTFSSS